MMVLGIILGVVLLIVVMIGIGGSIKEKNRRVRCKNWKDYAILKGWDLENLYIDCGDNMVYKVDWSVMNFNKSATWRQNYEEAKKVMGCDPEFSGGVEETNNSHSRIYEGKPIDTLTEIECEVYLKKALNEEDYDTAELIKQRMEKFR